MSDSRSTTVPLDDVDVIDASGPDVVAFLHAQLASDVRALAPGAARLSCWLNAQGRAIVVLALARTADDRMLLLVPHRRGAEIAARLARFVLRSKVALKLDPTLGAVGGAEPPAEGPGLVLPDGRAIAVAERRGAAADPAALAAWRLADVRAGVPWLVPELAEQFVPQALGLGRFGAYSVDKGCYPGQEIVARTHFLGRNKRRLVRYARAPGEPFAPGARLLPDAGHDVAAIVVAETAAPDGREGLAVVHEDVLAQPHRLTLVAFDDVPAPVRAAR